MLKANLERFDSPIVMINQVYESEDWGVVASYVCEQDVVDAEGEKNSAEMGWHVSVTLPNLDDMNFDQVFGTLEAALEFGISQIVSGNLLHATFPAKGLKDESHPFGYYHSIA